LNRTNRLSETNY